MTRSRSVPALLSVLLLCSPRVQADEAAPLDSIDAELSAWEAAPSVPTPPALNADDAVDASLDSPALISSPLYISARGSIAVPANGNGDVMVGGLGMGILVAPQHSVGLRFIYMHDPPSNPLATSTPEVPWAWGPVLDWQLTFSPEARASVFLHASLGYVYGTPARKSANNVILPILDGGVGLRLAKRLQDGSQIFIAPELGFVPAAVAPFSALNVGIVLPGR